ncbi:expressed hypothetical protein [Trichoplax adhaerens]|uniref:BTB domain-containing protein n=1 Tax=Trichoplax adhaerens TaxID=10228 RepID=B3RRI0_TRIAD|nr:expressed hypothetical protein [Trichoplax adhaerens]EDV26879.1 expressed hypothetical protein [Trichoplax adhaerens]|eukprot:XP_002110875.1 expressed hypothetical protein [Trichoplax adhaerens]
MGSPKYCTLEPIEELPQLEESQAGLTNLITDLSHLIDDRQSTDLIIYVGENKTPFYTHRLIIWARCKGFRNQHPSILSQSHGCQSPAIINKPYLNAQYFQQVVDYLYIGKINLDSSKVFPILAIADDFGIASLQSACVDQINSQRTIDNAISYYMVIRDIILSNDSEWPAVNEVKKSCLTFIDENAEDVTNTESFLHLSNESLIELVGRDDFALSEEEIWRSVLRWAKNKADVTGQIKSWNDSEKMAVSHHLSKVIHCIKLLLIDSEVYAQEIEPTGAVPMKLSLERYRFAAVPAAFNTATDNRLQPRKMKTLFSGSVLLSGDNLYLQSILNGWYGNELQQWKLIFRASRDGFSARQFHVYCDNIDPTFVIVRGPDDNLCGGFSDQPWSRKGASGSYTRSSKAFIFTLTNQQDMPPSRFDITQEKYALVYDEEYGPTFGAGADLCIASNCDSNDQSYSNFPYSFEGLNASVNLLMGSYNFYVKDYEVFTIK